MSKCPTAYGYRLVSKCLDCDNGNNFEDLANKVCEKRDLFSSRYVGYDLAGTIIWILTAGIATACGVGGGGIYVPMGILALKFAAKSSSGLSQASIFGAAMGGLMINMFGKHPNTKIVSGVVNKASEKIVYYSRPVIDYNMALFLAPVEMAGALLGMLVQKILPNWLYLSSAVIILAATAIATWKTWAKKRKAEIEASTQIIPVGDAGDSNGVELNSNVNTSGHASSSVVLGSENAAHEQESKFQNDLESASNQYSTVDKDTYEKNLPARIAFLVSDSRQFPMEKILPLGGLWLVLLLLTFLVGGKGVNSLVGVKCQDTLYPVLVSLQFVWLFGFSIYYGLNMVWEREQREAVQYPFQSADVAWSRVNLFFYFKWCFLAGIIAGLIGIGGGMVLGPLMLTMGVDPRVSTATTATMVVLTASSISIMYVISGYITWSYFIFFFIVCFIGAYIGKTYIDEYVKRTGSASMLIGLLATIISFSVIGCFIILYINLSDKDWCLDGFSTLCRA